MGVLLNFQARSYGCTAKQPRSELFFNKSGKQIGNINAIT